MTAAEPAERVWQVVSMIPVGQVATYGQVASLAGLPGRARFVGQVLANLPADTRLPWHRVVKSGLRIAERADPTGASEQRLRLLAEGVRFRGATAESAHQWQNLPLA